MIGWPNHPGSLELLGHNNFGSIFMLVLKLHPPYYLGGLVEDDVYYHIYLSSPLLDYDELIADVHGDNFTFTVEVESANYHLGGVASRLNHFQFYSQMALNLRHDANGIMLSKLYTVPQRSPYLIIRHYCELIG